MPARNPGVFGPPSLAREPHPGVLGPWLLKPDHPARVGRFLIGWGMGGLCIRVVRRIGISGRGLPVLCRGDVGVVGTPAEIADAVLTSEDMLALGDSDIKPTAEEGV